MSIKQNVERAKADYDEVYESGRQVGYQEVDTLNEELEQTLYGTDTGGKSFYDEFWDIFQDYGNRQSYTSAFATGWTNENFKPKYDICPTGDYGDNSLFYLNPVRLDVSKGLAYNGVKLDFSQATRMNATFDRSYVFNIPPIDAQSCKKMHMTFNSSKMDKITINNLREDCAFDRTFGSAYYLLELIINGTIGQNGFNVQWSTLLSKDSITSIINALSTTTSGLTVTLSKTAVNTAFETSEGASDGSTNDEWKALVATKSNWTISLI